MIHLHSSWNSDRIASTLLNKNKHPHRTSDKRPEHLYCEYLRGSLKLKTSRGAVRFSAEYDSDIVSAESTDEGLEVELKNGAHYLYRRVDKRYELAARNLPRASSIDTAGVLRAA